MNENAWHSGDGSNAKSGNRTSIGIEICERNYYKSLENAIELVVKMLKERNWGIDRLKRHYDWSGKNCPRMMNTDGNWTGWYEFLKTVESKLKSESVIESLYQITKDRISLSINELQFHDLNSKIGKATDVRHVFINKENIDKIKLVYEKGKKVSQLLTSHKADLAINCAFYNRDNGVPSGYFKDSDGITRSTPYGKTLKWKQFNVIDNSIKVSDFNNNVTNACFQSAPLLVENGVPVYKKYIKEHEIQNDVANGISQRTFMWWDKNDNIHIGIADGRTSYDIGLTCEEMALYAIHHGAVTAVTYDGGGSTILVDKTGSLNQAANRGSNERVNHHALLFYFKPEEQTKNIDTDKYPLVNVVVNGKQLVTKGFLINNLTHVPLRAIGNAIGADVGWDQAKKEASINGRIVNGIIINNTTYVPLRVLSNVIGARIDWNQSTFTASLSNK